MVAAAAAAAAARAAIRTPALRNAAARLAAQAKPAASPLRPAQSPLSSRIFRSPVVMSVSVESLLPLHSASASSRMNSMLSASPGSFGWFLQACTDDL